MARTVGIFRDDATVQDVVEQLQLNGIEQITIINAQSLPAAGQDDPQEVANYLRGLGIPVELLDEYCERLQHDLRLLMVQSSATELPMVQRAMRSAQAIDIDLLPEASA